MADNNSDSIGAIHVNWKHIDGPLMRLPCGRLKWLTMRERFMHWIGKWSLEDIARRPDGFSKLVYYPPHDTWLSLKADEAFAQTKSEGSQ